MGQGATHQVRSGRIRRLASATPVSEWRSAEGAWALALTRLVDIHPSGVLRSCSGVLLLPVCCPCDDSGHLSGSTLEHLCCSWLTRPPGNSGSRSAFPLQSERPCVSGGLVSSSTMACGFGGVNANVSRPVDDLGDNSGTLVDGRGAGCGQPGGCLGTSGGTRDLFALDDLLQSSGRRLWTGKKLRTWCRDPVRYSGR
jgi:hypothetical protein